MSWRTAFLAQARSDNDVRGLLNQSQLPYAHQLHYLQMTTEKLAKGILTGSGDAERPLFTHASFVRCLQVLKGRREIRARLNYVDTATFTAYINALLPIAAKVERLAPAGAGGNQPNPEYPWKPTPGGEVIAPCQFEFPGFGARDPQIVRLIKFVETLLEVTS